LVNPSTAAMTRGAMTRRLPDRRRATLQGAPHCNDEAGTFQICTIPCRRPCARCTPMSRAAAPDR